MITTLREMPGGVRLFLAYALVLLAALGLSLPLIVDQAISDPIAGPGLVAMLLLAYVIFTITLALQRKQAAYGLSMGLATLTIPLVPLGLLAGVPVLALFGLVLALLLFRGLRQERSRSWFREP